MFQATIAAAITEKSPFATPMNRKEEANLAKAALSVANSDHLTIYNAYLGYGTSTTSLKSSLTADPLSVSVTNILQF